jgi:tRNA threonylcarbamoyladenosine biosynthesis protein TsaE
MSHSAAETHRIGSVLGKELALNEVIALSGDLGAGKTVFIRGVAEGAAEIDPRDVCSPTFTYLNVYSGIKTIYHFDLYRIRDFREFLAAGFEDFLAAGGICCIEWPEKIDPLLKSYEKIIEVKLTYLEEGIRKIEVGSR